MTNLNTTPNPFGKHSFRDNAVDSAANQTYEFDIDGSVAASVENTAAAKPKFGRRSFLTGFAGAALACMLAFGVQGAIIDPATAEATGTPSATQTVINTNDDATLAEAVAAKCLPSVVYVETYADAGGQLQGLGTGSGVVMTEDGYLITNNHVVDGGSAYKVTIAGNTYDAELVGTDPSSDVAVLKAKDASGLTPMEIGDSDNLTVGRVGHDPGRSLRARAVGGHGHRVRHEPLADHGRERVDAVRRQRRDHYLSEHDPDRRGHQPWQLRWRARG